MTPKPEAYAAISTSGYGKLPTVQQPVTSGGGSFSLLLVLSGNQQTLKFTTLASVMRHP